MDQIACILIDIGKSTDKKRPGKLPGQKP